MVREAEVAFVGTLVGGSAEGKAGGAVQQPILTTWAVERSRDPLDSDRMSISTWPDDGANCGTAFGANERWLLLAYEGERPHSDLSSAKRLRVEGPEAMRKYEAKHNRSSIVWTEETAEASRPALHRRHQWTLTPSSSPSSPARG